MDIKESDWKVFRRLHSVALERYCQRVLEEVKLATACNDSYHDCYRAEAFSQELQSRIDATKSISRG